MVGRQRTGDRWACGDRSGGRTRGRANTTSVGVVVLLVLVATSATAARASTVYFKDRAGVMHFTNVPTDTRYKVLRTAKSTFSQVVYKPGVGAAVRAASRSDGLVSLRNFALSTRGPEPSPELADMITETARRGGVDPALVHAVVRAESGFDHRAVSRAGAMGLMQLMPGTADLVGVRNAFHPQENVEGGVSYLRQMLERFGGNVQLALAAYNAGPGAVESHGGIPPYSETQDYVERVFRYRQDYLRKKVDRRLASRSVSAR